jgi:hypothetical protein
MVRSGQGAELPAVEISECLCNLMLAVHDERAVLYHGFVDGLAVQDEQVR